MSKKEAIKCRRGCGACCIAISITSSIPEMPNGKPSGVRCIHLSKNNDCQLFGKPERPNICKQFQAVEWICGRNKFDASKIIYALEQQTAPKE